jgi:hypothetical protein
MNAVTSRVSSPITGLCDLVQFLLKFFGATEGPRSLLLSFQKVNFVSELRSEKSKLFVLEHPEVNVP